MITSYDMRLYKGLLSTIPWCTCTKVCSQLLQDALVQKFVVNCHLMQLCKGLLSPVAGCTSTQVCCQPLQEALVQHFVVNCCREVEHVIASVVGEHLFGDSSSDDSATPAMREDTDSPSGTASSTLFTHCIIQLDVWWQWYLRLQWQQHRRQTGAFYYINLQNVTVGNPHITLYFYFMTNKNNPFYVNIFLPPTVRIKWALCDSYALDITRRRSKPEYGK